MAKPQFWGGRFNKDLSELMWEFSRGTCIDRYLFPYDIKATCAHVKVLEKAGILSPEEKMKLLTALDKLSKLYSVPDYEEEDIHSFVQEALRKAVGDLADKIHTGRSRNDLVAADSILMLKDWALNLGNGIRKLQTALVKLAREYKDVIIPSYTHLQEAQLVYFAHYLLSYVEAFERIKEFFSWFAKNQKSPLTACAGAGTSIALDAKTIAQDLGLEQVYENSIDAIANRDYYLDILYGISRLALLFSRMCEDWIIYSSSEFGFLVLPEEFTTGSSIMPHKKNPDTLELIRSRSGQIITALFATFTMLKALPLSYNRDLQEDKEIAIPALLKVSAMIDVLTELIHGIKVDTHRLSSILENDFLYATDLMEVLIKKGLSSRKAHHCVGELVKLSESQGIALRNLDINRVKEITKVDISQEEYRLIFDPVRSVESKISYNGTCSKNVDKRLKYWMDVLEVS